MKKLRRFVMVLLPVIVAVLFMTLINATLTSAQTSAVRNGYTVFRDGLIVAGRLTTVGPVRIGGGGTIGVYNTDGDMVMAVDSVGNITTTGNITTVSGFSTTNLVRGFSTATARLVGSITVPTTTVTGTAVVAIGPFSELTSGNCSLQIVPTTSVSSCALDVVAGDLVANVYDANNNLAINPAAISWFAWVEDEG